MPFSLSSALVLRPILRALLHDEAALYTATRDVIGVTTTAEHRELLGGQLVHIDAQLQQLAWQLGYWGDGGADSNWLGIASASSAAEGENPDTVRSLEQLHRDLLRQIHRFMARTSWLESPSLKSLWSDLRAGHVAALAELRGIAAEPCASAA